jgi:hypothetical protein
MMPGPRKVACVEIGRIAIALATSDDAFLDLLRERYEGFLSSSPPEFELEFDLTSTRSASDDDVRVRREPDEAQYGKMQTRILSIRCCVFCTA